MEALQNIDIKQSALIGILLAVVYYFVLFDDGKNLANQLNQIETEIGSSKSSLTNIQVAIENKKKFDQEAEEINTNIEAFLSYFPTDLDPNGFMKSISKAVEDNASTVISLKPISKAPEFQGYPEMAFSFEVEGPYHNIMGFISDLTQLKRAIDFQETKIRVVAQEANPRIQFSTTLVVFGHTPEAPSRTGSQ